MGRRAPFYLSAGARVRLLRDGRPRGLLGGLAALRTRGGRQVRGDAQGLLEHRVRRVGRALVLLVLVVERRRRGGRRGRDRGGLAVERRERDLVEGERLLLHREPLLLARGLAVLVGLALGEALVL